MVMAVNKLMMYLILKDWIRRRRDSNPRYPSGYSGFQDHRHRPLGHPSAVKIRPESARIKRIAADSPRQCNAKCNDRDGARRHTMHMTRQTQYSGASAAESAVDRFLSLRMSSRR